MAFGIGRKLKKTWNKYKREIVGTATLGASEITRELSGYNQMKQMEELADQQAQMQEQQLKLAQRQAAINAGSTQQVSNAGTQEALAKMLRKKSALVKASPTLGQNRGRETLG